jgi:hypothetical protein
MIDRLKIMIKGKKKKNIIEKMYYFAPFDG